MNGAISARRFSARLAMMIPALFAVLLPYPAAVAVEKKPPKVVLSGTLLIQWNDESRFIYVSDPQNGLRFQTRDGREIKPSRMYTDGGSIPRVFWSVKGFSPWGYGPAYVLHDWLFHQHRCGNDDPPNRYSIEQANEALDDAINLLMDQKRVEANQRARRLIKWAVDKYALTAWNEPCDAEPPSPDSKALTRPNITIDRIAF
jgi:Protein of unknown function (DUF1353)